MDSLGVSNSVHANICTRFSPTIPSQWTIRRLLMSLIKKFNVQHKKGDNTENLARTLDFFVVNNGNLDVDNRKQRNLDFGRLLMLMFGTPHVNG